MARAIFLITIVAYLATYAQGNTQNGKFCMCVRETGLVILEVTVLFRQDVRLAMVGLIN